MSDNTFSAPFYPIIYIRGYAMSQSEIEQTTADPFCGFNLGSTVYRAVPNKESPPRKFMFESPVVRLASEFGYRDVYEDGYDILDEEWNDGIRTLGPRPIVIHRYYDPASALLGSGKVPPIEEFARALSLLVARVRTLVCANPANAVTPDRFRCYLVAHSMGGLVARAFLQNPALDTEKVVGCVDKFFTFATPHNGIDVAGVNIPSWLKLFDVDNFDRDRRMPDYLNLKAAHQKHKRVDLIPEKRFPASRVFCMVGTNRLDYEAAAGLSRTFVGHGSDGLVRIQNATLCGLKDTGEVGEPCAKAFTYRSHSGFYGIVNSEEAFQNLSRFLFGDVRVDIWLDVDDIRLPPGVEAEAAKGREVDALYQIELQASPRGKLWSLTRRMTEEDSVACLPHKGWKQYGPMYLSSVFLSLRARVNPDDPSVNYAMMFNVRVPDYEIERKLWVNDHYEGGYLFRNALRLRIVAPVKDGDQWSVEYAWQGTGVAKDTNSLQVRGLKDGKVSVEIPFDSCAPGPDGKPVPTKPGMAGRLRLVVSRWNS